MPGYQAPVLPGITVVSFPGHSLLSPSGSNSPVSMVPSSSTAEHVNNLNMIEYSGGTGLNDCLQDLLKDL
jgi:hypothetical protein